MRDAKAKTGDIDYLLFKLRQNGEEIKLGDDGKIKGVADMVTTLKTAHPGNFDGEQSKKIDQNELPHGDANTELQPTTLAEALQYADEHKEN